MPPKAKVTKNEIISKAFELTKQHGFNHITARLLANELGCSTQPIFHAFSSMGELKMELYKKTREYFTTVMTNPPQDFQTPLFLSMGLKYIELAQTEKHLFQLLCMSDSFQLNSIYDLGKEMPIPMDKKLFVKIWIFTHGIASIVATNTSPISNNEVRELLIEAAQNFKSL